MIKVPPRKVIALISSLLSAANAEISNGKAALHRVEKRVGIHDPHETCQNRRSYRSRQGLPCESYSWLICNRFDLVGFSKFEVEGLLNNCSKSCNAAVCGVESSAEMFKTSESVFENYNLNLAPEAPSPNDPTEVDNPFYISRQGGRCISFAGLNCLMFRFVGYSELDVYHLVKNCPVTCNLRSGTLTITPSSAPSQVPSISMVPSLTPSGDPSQTPTSRPSLSPSAPPSRTPSRTPSYAPSGKPSSIPTISPTTTPSYSPSLFPSSSPSETPTLLPSSRPSSKPSRFPSASPSEPPTSNPSSIPSSQPSAVPTMVPTSRPSIQPSSEPTASPSHGPSHNPSLIPSFSPTLVPTIQPSSEPSSNPSQEPSASPSDVPSSSPSLKPSSQPSSWPSVAPSLAPSRQPSPNPSHSPSDAPSYIPSSMPSSQPSDAPTHQPSSVPSVSASRSPSSIPTSTPTSVPSVKASSEPSSLPSDLPSSNPTNEPSDKPSSLPSLEPSSGPSVQPTPASTLFEAQAFVKLDSITSHMDAETILAFEKVAVDFFSESIRPPDHVNVDISAVTLDSQILSSQFGLDDDPFAVVGLIVHGIVSPYNPRDFSFESIVINAVDRDLRKLIKMLYNANVLRSRSPTVQPSIVPSLALSSKPSVTLSPTGSPSFIPSLNPSSRPSLSLPPTLLHSSWPSSVPSSKDSTEPSSVPSLEPSFSPSENPTPSFSTFKFKTEVKFDTITSQIDKEMATIFETVAKRFFSNFANSSKTVTIDITSVTLTYQIPSSDFDPGSKPPYVLFGLTVSADVFPYNPKNFSFERMIMDALSNNFVSFTNMLLSSGVLPSFSPSVQPTGSTSRESLVPNEFASMTKSSGGPSKERSAPKKNAARIVIPLLVVPAIIIGFAVLAMKRKQRIDQRERDHAENIDHVGNSGFLARMNLVSVPRVQSRDESTQQRDMRNNPRVPRLSSQGDGFELLSLSQNSSPSTQLTRKQIQISKQLMKETPSLNFEPHFDPEPSNVTQQPQTSPIETRLRSNVEPRLSEWGGPRVIDRVESDTTVGTMR